MKIKINYPSEQSGVELLNKGIEEFKARVYRKVCVNFRLLMIKILKLH